MRTPRWVRPCTTAAQVVEVARQTIHAVHHDRVAFAHEGEQPFQFGPPCVLARRLVGEHFIHRICSSCRSGFWSKLLTRT